MMVVVVVVVVVVVIVVVVVPWYVSRRIAIPGDCIRGDYNKV